MTSETYGIHRVDLPARAACMDCGAGTGAPCNEACPTRQALDAQRILDDLADVPEPCCPSPSYAAATLCGCQGVPA